MSSFKNAAIERLWAVLDLLLKSSHKKQEIFTHRQGLSFGIGTVPKQNDLTMESMEGLRPEAFFLLNALHVLHGDIIFRIQRSFLLLGCG